MYVYSKVESIQLYFEGDIKKWPVLVGNQCGAECQCNIMWNMDRENFFSSIYHNVSHFLTVVNNCERKKYFFFCTLFNIIYKKKYERKKSNKNIRHRYLKQSNHRQVRGTFNKFTQRDPTFWDLVSNFSRAILCVFYSAYIYFLSSP